MTAIVKEQPATAPWRHSWGAAGLQPGRSGSSAERRPHGRLPVRTGVPTVRSFAVPAHRRLALAVAEAALVRDTAAFGAFVLFATMVALVLGGADAPL